MPYSDPTVLLVEDNEINQAVAVAMLERQGYCVDVVPTVRRRSTRSPTRRTPRSSWAARCR